MEHQLIVIFQRAAAISRAYVLVVFIGRSSMHAFNVWEVALLGAIGLSRVRCSLCI